MKHLRKKNDIACLFVLTFFSLVAPESLYADVVQISASKDNTLYEDAQGDISNGAGTYFFVGRTNQISNFRRRALVAFDLSGSIPTSSIIQSVTLSLHLSNEPFMAPARTITLRRLLDNWGEGTSDAIGAEGSGVAATTNDATWLHQFFSTDVWATAGGDFSGTISGSISVDNIGSYTVASTAQMVADVQSWLDNPAANFGWLLLGNESIEQSARRFDSKENSTAAFRPYLTVTFDPPCCIGIRGDIDGNGTTADVQDLTYMINDIYRGGPDSPCPEEADLDNSGTPSTVQDLTYLINDIFRGGPNPPACP